MSAFEGSCQRRTHARTTLATIALALGGAVVLIALTSRLPQRDSRAFGLASAIELGVLALGYAWWAFARMPNAVRTPVHVRASDVALRIDDETIATSEIATGVILQVDGAVIVRLARRRRTDVDLVVAGVEEGRALLRALGKDASQAVVRFYAGSRLLAYGGVVFAAVAVLGPLFSILGAMAHTAAPGLAFFFFMIVLLLWPSRVDVGPDGIRHAWLWWRKFIPSTRVGSAEDAQFGRRPIGLRVPCGEEDPHEIHVVGPNKDALEERIREIAGQKPAADAPSVLARGGMPAREWIAALRSLASPATYRRTAIDIEALWRIVEAPGASREDRAAAAIIVARDDDARTKLRVAASAIAEPKLRVAIEAAASEDVDSLEQALDDLREL